MTPGALLDLQHRLDSQSSFMLAEPGEREQASDRRRGRLQGQGRSESFDLLAEKDGRLADWLSVEVLLIRRASGCGCGVMGVDATESGHGIRRGLPAALPRQAPGRGGKRSCLCAITHFTQSRHGQRRSRAVRGTIIPGRPD